MLTLDETQWFALRAYEHDQFVAQVCSQYLEQRPECRQQPGELAVSRRMRRGLDYAQELGFTRNGHIVRLMYLAADAPAVIGDEILTSHLSRAGATPEERLDDLDAVINWKLKELR